MGITPYKALMEYCITNKCVETFVPFNDIDFVYVLYRHGVDFDVSFVLKHYLLLTDNKTYVKIPTENLTVYVLSIIYYSQIMKQLKTSI